MASMNCLRLRLPSNKLADVLVAETHPRTETWKDNKHNYNLQRTGDSRPLIKW